jgi:hypothetical protein
LTKNDATSKRFKLCPKKATQNTKLNSKGVPKSQQGKRKKEK